jgi:hypothetical protein
MGKQCCYLGVIKMGLDEGGGNRLTHESAGFFLGLNGIDMIYKMCGIVYNITNMIIL